MFTKLSVSKLCKKYKLVSSTSSVSADDPDKSGFRLQKRKNKEIEMTVMHQFIKVKIDASIAQIPSTVSRHIPHQIRAIVRL